MGKLEIGLFKKWKSWICILACFGGRIPLVLPQSVSPVSETVKPGKGKEGRARPSHDGVWVEAGSGMCCLSLTSRGQHRQPVRCET